MATTHALYTADPYAKEFEAELVECRLDHSVVDGAFAVELDRSAFYPTGGGQPHDTGSIGSARVLDVRKFDERVVHFVDRDPGGGPLPCRINWARRFDHMQQHSGQHLLSAIADDQFGWSTMAFHLGEFECTVDLDTHSIQTPQLKTLEASVNLAIRDARCVRARHVSIAAFESLEVRSRGLPAGFSGEVRLVEIEGLDLNTCGGTHIRNTAELQALALLGTEKIRRGQTRLRFCVGGRVLDTLHRGLAHQHGLTELLKSAPAKHADLVRRALKERKAIAKERGRVLRELGEFLGDQLAAAHTDITVHHRDDADMAFLDVVAMSFSRHAPAAPAVLSAGQADAGAFVLLGPEPWLDKAMPLVLDHLKARGGGKAGRRQGKASKLDGATRASLLEALRGLVP